MDARYNHFSRGDIVRLKDGVEVTPANESLVEAGRGRVSDMHNAGFRGLEYQIQIGHVENAEFCHNVSAADLELVSAAPLRAWAGQITYRDGARIDPQIEKRVSL